MCSRYRPALLLCLILLQFTAAAQLRPVYLFQKDDTLIKRNYYDQVISKKNKLIGSVGKEHANDYKKIYEEQYTEIGNLVKGERTVTDASAHEYIQAIAKKIVAANPELKDLDTRIVFTRDWWPNAVSMGDGTLAFNAGLLVYLDNEAEMVFVLCHELAHYYLDHSNKSIKKYVETINSESYKAELKRLSKEEFRVRQQYEEFAKKAAFDFRRHSRDNEAEADRYAWRFMKRTGYDCNAIRTCLELLDKVDDSLLYKPLVLEQAFSFPEYPFKKKWTQKQSAIFSQLDQNDGPLTQKERDSLKTHPDCAKRIVLLQDSIASVPGGKKFQVDEAKFRQLKNDFRVEIMELTYKQDNLSRNIYYALLQLQQNEHKPVAIYTIARGLNDMYVAQRDHTLGLKVSKENRFYPGDYNLLLRMIDRLRLEEIAALNYHFCKKYKAEMEGYSEFDELYKKAESRMSASQQ